MAKLKTYEVEYSYKEVDWVTIEAKSEKEAIKIVEERYLGEVKDIEEVE